MFHGFLWVLEHVLPTSIYGPLVSPIKAWHQRRLVTKVKRRGPGRAFSVDSVDSISPYHFFCSYFLKNRPLVLKGFAKDWDCQSWSLDSLARDFSDDETVITGHGDMDTQSLAATIRQIKTGTIKNARVSNLLQSNKSLRDSVPFDSLKKYLPIGSFISSYQFFLGGSKNFTPLHAGLSNNFSIQLYGNKRWKIIPTHLNPLLEPIVDGGPLLKSQLELSDPSLCSDGIVSFLDFYDVVLEPGDVLFNPSFFWHYVEYESESITVGLRWIHLYSTFRSSLLMAFLVLTAYNPSAFKSFIKIRKSISMPFYS